MTPKQAFVETCKTFGAILAFVGSAVLVALLLVWVWTFVAPALAVVILGVMIFGYVFLLVYASNMDE